MCKKILGNQRGMSLIEVVVASAVSIIIAMGVMQINENAQKGISRLNEMTDIQKFEDLVHTRLSKPGRCADANIGGANTFGTADITANVAIPRLRTAYQTGGDPDEFTVSATQTIPSAPGWRVSSAFMSAYNAGGAGALVGECDIIITAEKVKKTAIGMRTKIIRIPMSCRVDGSDAIQDCQAIINSDEEGYWKSTTDTVGGDFLLFNGTTGDPRIKIGDTPAFTDANISAALTVEPIAGQTDGSARLHGIALPTNTSLTFGNGTNNALYYGGTGNTLESNGGFRTAGNIYTTGNIFATNKVSAGSLRSPVGWIGTLDVLNLDVTDLDVARIDVDLLRVDNVSQHSDRRFKKHIETIRNASDDISELRGVTYFMRRDEFPKRNFDNKLHHGLIAQEVERVFPNLVHTDEKSGYKSVQYSNIVSILIEAFKEQQVEIENNKNMFLVMKEGIKAKEARQDLRLDALEKENRALRLELDELKDQVRKILMNKD
jgi:hypothetical protein